jgi:hypothetical protein
MGGTEGLAVLQKIDENWRKYMRTLGARPTACYVGKVEMEAIKGYISPFLMFTTQGGEDGIVTMYMGMELIEVNKESYLGIGGFKCL